MKSKNMKSKNQMSQISKSGLTLVLAATISSVAWSQSATAKRPVAANSSPVRKAVANSRVAPTPSRTRTTSPIRAASATRVASAMAPIPLSQASTPGHSSANVFKVAPQVVAPPKIFSFNAIFGVGSDLLDGAEPEHSVSGELDLRPSIQIDSHWKASGQLVLSQEWNQRSTMQVKDPVLSVSYGAPLSRDWRLSSSLALIFPVSDKSREVNQTKIATKVAPRLAFDFAKTGREGLMQLSGYYQPSLARTFHEGAVSRTGGPLTMVRFENKAVLGYTIGHSDFSLGLAGILASNWDYSGVVRNNDFVADESLNYQATSNLALSIGHTNAGDVYKETGEDNFAIVDPQSSTVYLALDLML